MRSDETRQRVGKIVILAEKRQLRGLRSQDAFTQIEKEHIVMDERPRAPENYGNEPERGGNSEKQI